MDITIHLPEEIANQLGSEWGDLPRRTLEALAIEAYRSNLITTAQIQKMLNFSSRWEVDDFLKRSQVYLPYTEADLDQDSQTLNSLLSQ